MPIIECSAKELMGQASSTAFEYLGEAVRLIDRVMGEGYAKKNPALVAAFMETCARDYAASMQGRCADEIGQYLGDISLALEKLAERD